MQAQTGDAAILGFIEVLNSGGRLLERIAWSGQPLTVGRSYDNDIVVGDPYVSNQHLEIRWDSGAREIFITDRSSRNGTRDFHSNRPIRSESIAPGQEIAIGHSLIRFMAAGAPAAPALKDFTTQGPLRWFSKPWLAIFFIAAALLAMYGDAALDAGEAFSFSQATGNILVPLMGVLLWVGLWAFLSFTESGRWRILAHAGIVSAFLALWFVSSTGLSLLSFGMGWDAAYPWLSWVLQWAIYGTMLMVHARYAIAARPARQALACYAIMALLLGFSLLDRVQQLSEFSSVPKIEPLLKPPQFQLGCTSVG